MLRHIPPVNDPRVLVDATSRDDAAVFRMSEDRALVVTLDFFTPIVDDAYDFGAIAAANAFSDLYAMGARPLLALNLVGWPREPEMLELLGETIRGGVDIATEAGAFVLGGHSIDDREPKYGMVAVGEVHPDRLITNSGARPGDALILTKPLGTGILSTALKRGIVDDEGMKPAVRSMSTLNAGAARAMEQVRHSVHAATDVTGFGLLGHLFNVCHASDVSARITVSGLPVFDRVRELIGEGVIPGGTTRNLEAADEFAQFDPSVEASDKVVVSDAQTSGGLLIAVDPEAELALLAALAAEGTLAAARVGEVTLAGARAIEVVA